MNKTVTLLLACALAVPAIQAGKTVPYTSDIGVNYGVDEGWITSAARNSTPFSYFANGDDGTDTSVAGTQGGMSHAYDAQNAADCWVISPAISLEAGKTYTVSFWAKTRDADAEAFELRAGTEQNSTNLKAGDELIKKPFFKSPDGFTLQSATYTVTEGGDRYFGIHCFSEANSYTFYITGLSVTEEGAGPVDPDNPENPDNPDNPEAQQLPYNIAFNSTDVFNTWTSLAGPDAVVKTGWHFNSFMNCAEFDSAEGYKEDNYFISPAMNFPAAGTYKVKFNGSVYGELDLMLGTDATDVSSFTSIGRTGVISEFDNVFTYWFTIETPGQYRLAARACAETGTMMGYRLNNFTVTSDAPVPVAIADPKAVADPDDALKATVTWTEPSLDHHGASLPSITKTEIYRNDVLIHTILNPSPGASETYVDMPEEAGTCSYHVLAYNENGSVLDGIVRVSAGYVGKPTAAMPYDFDISDYDDAGDEDVSKITVIDANSDGLTWVPSFGWWGDFTNTLPEEGTADDYLATPYVTLEAGKYYSFSTSINARYTDFQLGYLTKRNDVNTFQVLKDFENVQDYGNTTQAVIFEVPATGEYALAVRCHGAIREGAYNNIKVRTLNIAEYPKLPAQPEALVATEAAAGGVDLAWVNPAVDILGNVLPAETQVGYVIKRNGTAIATIEPNSASIAGQQMSYTDAEATEGDFVYTISVKTSAGEATSAPAVAGIFIGTAKDAPYATEEFTEFLPVSESSYYAWTLDEEDNTLNWNYYYSNVPKAYAMAPMLNLEANTDYKVSFTLLNSAYSACTANFCASKARVLAAIENVCEFSIPASSEELPGAQVYDFNVTTREAMTLAGEEQQASYVSAGKTSFGILPTSAGTLKLSAFSIEKNTQNGLETIVAGNGGILYRDGKVTFPEGARDIVICNPAGQTIFSANTAAEYDVRTTGIIIVKATVNGRKVTLKLNVR